MNRVGCILELPPELLAGVIVRLPQQDRLAIRQTCRHFRDISNLPEFFRKRSFTIIGEDEEEGQRISRYLENFGFHLQDLTINIDIFETRSRDPVVLITLSANKGRMISSELNEIFIFLEQQLLKSFHFHGFQCLEIPCIQITPERRAGLLTALCSMLRRQHQLSVVNITDCILEDDEASQLLGALCSHHTVTLRSLKLLRFFRRPYISFDFNVDECLAFLKALERLTLIEKVTFGYHLLSDTVLVTLINASSFLTLVVLIRSTRDYNIPLLPSLPNWQLVVNKTPDLRVCLDLEVTSATEIRNYLLPAMPLVRLRIYMENHYFHSTNDEITTEIDDFKTSLGHWPHLKTVILSQLYEDGLWSDPEPLVALVEACPSLTLLCLPFTLSRDTLMQVAAAALPRGGHEEEEEEEGHPARPPLHIHIKELKTVKTFPEKNTMEKLLKPVNPFCTVHACSGCQLLL